LSSLGEEVAMAVYTLGIWTVKPGHEEEFISAWREMAARTKADFPDASAVLLRDRDAPNRFVSSGPWDSLEQVEAWRASPSFRDGVAKIREFLDRFEPHTMDPVVTIAP
jgi:heme-degrading monooxygenase HmoA